MATVMEPTTIRLNQLVLFVAPSLGYWRGNYCIKGTNLAFAGVPLNAEQFTIPRTKLLEGIPELRDWKARFQGFESRRQSLVNKFTTAFPIHGIRVLPRDSADDFFTEAEDIRNELEQAANEFVDSYDHVMGLIERGNKPEVWAYVKRLIPPQGAMRSKFYFDVVPIEMNFSRGEDSGSANRFEQQMHEAVDRKVDEAIESMIREPREQLAKALTDLHELIGRNGRLTSRSFNGIKDAIDKIRLFKFVATDTLMRQIDELENRLDTTVPARIADNQMSANGLMTVLAKVRDEVADETQLADDIERLGRPLRRFSFAD